eukprot:XP_001698230.1 hypothetical protein CHLREDRAFT_151619 [Chlamydomonas reinhardtii]
MSFACKQHTVALRPARAAVVVPCPRHVTARFGQSSSEFEPKCNDVPLATEMDDAQNARLEAMAKEAYRRAQDVLKGNSQNFAQAQPTTLQSLYDLARTSLTSVDSASPSPAYELLLAAEGEAADKSAASGADADAPPAAPGGRFGPRVFAFNLEEEVAMAESEEDPAAAAAKLEGLLAARAARLA